MAASAAELREIASIFRLHEAEIDEHSKFREEQETINAQTEAKLAEIEGYLAVLDRTRQSVNGTVDELRRDMKTFGNQLEVFRGEMNRIVDNAVAEVRAAARRGQNGR